MASQLESILRDRTSKAVTMRGVEYVGNSSERLRELFDIILNGDSLLSRRASWCISYIAENHTQLFRALFPVVLDLASDVELHAAYRRNALKLLESIEIPEEFHGKVLDICFAALQNPNEAIAPKAYAMGILRTLCDVYPDIKQEVISALHPYAGLSMPPALRSRSLALLRAFGVAPLY